MIEPEKKTKKLEALALHERTPNKETSTVIIHFLRLLKLTGFRSSLDSKSIWTEIKSE
jgi:hypothetical protein